MLIDVLWCTPLGPLWYYGKTKQSLKLVYQQPTPNEIRLSFQRTSEGIL
jgi:hypothetical protein